MDKMNKTVGMELSTWVKIQEHQQKNDFPDLASAMEDLILKGVDKEC